MLVVLVDMKCLGLCTLCVVYRLGKSTQRKPASSENTNFMATSKL